MYIQPSHCRQISFCGSEQQVDDVKAFGIVLMFSRINFVESVFEVVVSMEIESFDEFL